MLSLPRTVTHCQPLMAVLSTLSLSLLVPGIIADYHYSAFSFDNLALFASFLY